MKKKRSFQRFVFDPQLTFIFLRLETTCFVVLHLLWQRFEIIPTPGMLSMLNSAVWINGGLPHVKWPFKSCKWWLRWILGYFGWFIWWNMMIFPLKRQMMIYTWLPPQRKERIGDFPTFHVWWNPGFLKASAMPSRMREVPGVDRGRGSATAFGYTLQKSQSLTSSICILDVFFL